MGVPGRAGSWLERDVRTLRATRSGCLEQRLDTHLAGEPFRRSIFRRSGSTSLNVHVFTPLWLDSGSEAGAVDHEPIAHVAAPHACIRVVNLVSLDEFDVRGDSMLPAVVEHLLRLGNPADVGAREALVAVDKGKRVERDAGGGQSNEDHGSEIPQGGIRGDARTHEGCGSRRVQSLGDAQHVALVDDYVRRITAVRPRLPVRLEAVERERDALLAEHLVAGAAFRAHPARIDEAAYAREVALAEAGCAGTLGHDSADDLVARHDRKVGGPPVVVHLVHVAVANAAVEN